MERRSTGMPDMLAPRLIAAGVPVTLLVDLLSPPDADELYVVEGGAADWLVAPAAGAA